MNFGLTRNQYKQYRKKLEWFFILYWIKEGQAKG